MDNHILFFIIAGFLIAVLIGFSLWSARREKSQIFSNTFSKRPPATPINNELNVQVPPTLSGQDVHSQPNRTLDTVQPDFASSHQEEIENSVKNIQIRLSDSEQQPTISEPVVYEQPVPQPEPEPLPFEQPAPQPQVQLEQPQEVEVVEETEEEVAQNTNIITLYVVAAEGQQFTGDTVVQNLETLGFEFGEYQIFHRHLNDSSSPVLFSVANMMQPGVFDLNNIDKFRTVGLVFFMHLPSSVGSDITNLRLMIRTVESFAQSVGGFVLNDQQSLFDDQSRQDYLLRVSQQ